MLDLARLILALAIQIQICFMLEIFESGGNRCWLLKLC